MRGLVVCFNSASNVIRRKIRASESATGRNLVKAAWLNHNAWILLGTRIKRVLSARQEQTEPVQAAGAGR